jgi:sugar lactone lactonase YvrE
MQIINGRNMKHLMFLTLIALQFACTSGNRKTGDAEQAPGNGTETIQSVQISKVWSSEPQLLTCESTLYDMERDIIYVSNINGNPTEKNGEGYISKMTTEGNIEQLHWVVGLHAPKGMAVRKNTLYVTDIDMLVEIDVEKGVVSQKHPVEGASFLNDVAVDEHGRVYFTDSDTGTIHILEDGTVSVWKKDASFARPNGLYNSGKSLLLALSGSGKLLSIDYASGAIDVVAEGIGHGDGIAPDGRGNLFVSNWAGQVFFVAADGQLQLLLDTRDQQRNSADIDYIIDKNLLLVPTFFKNTVDAFEVSYQ